MIRDFIASNAWTWPVLVYLATGALNFIVWFHDSEEWDRFQREYPKWATTIRLLRAYGLHVRKQVSK
jgi:hypothetical protein